MNRRLSALFALLLACAVSSVAAQQATRLAISQAVQTASAPAEIRVYLDLLDGSGEPAREVAVEDLAASLGGEPAIVDELDPFSEVGDGVGYVFLVDISRSLDEPTFGRIRDALRAWIDDLGPEDRAAILSFGETSRLVVDFTDDKDRLRTGLGTLGPTDDLTVIHRALRDALELGQRRDPGLPTRRVVVVLSDGFDEGSGLTPDDVLRQLREMPLPIYAIGYSRLREPQRARYLAELRRLASNSGGDFFAADRTEFDEAYAAIRRAVERVWVAELTCPTCTADGRAYRLQLDLEQGGRVLSQGTDLRLLPGRETLAAARQPPASADDAPVQRRPDATPAAAEEPAEKPAGDGGIPIWVWALAGVVALGALAVVLARREPEPEEGSELPPPIDLDDVDTGEVLATLDTRPVRLVVVRGSRKGKEYAFVLGEAAVVGKRSICDCVLSDEEHIDGEQFELYQLADGVWVRNLSSSKPTYKGGRKLEGDQKVKTGDLIGTRETILRIVLGDG